MTFLVNWMFSRLGRFDGPMFWGGGRGGGGAGLYWGCLLGYIFGRRMGGVLTGFYGIQISRDQRTANNLFDILIDFIKKYY